MTRRGFLLFCSALAAAAALLGAELGAGGLGYGSGRLHDPCKPRTALAGRGVDPTAQRFVLRGLDALACRLGRSREQLVLDLADRGVDLVALAKRLEKVGSLLDLLDWIRGLLRPAQRS